MNVNDSGHQDKIYELNDIDYLKIARHFETQIYLLFTIRKSTKLQETWICENIPMLK